MNILLLPCEGSEVRKYCLCVTVFKRPDKDGAKSSSYGKQLTIEEATEWSHCLVKVREDLLYIQCSLQFCVKLVDIAHRKMQTCKIGLINLMVILVIFLPLFVHKYM